MMEPCDVRAITLGLPYKHIGSGQNSSKKCHIDEDQQSLVSTPSTDLVHNEYRNALQDTYKNTMDYDNLLQQIDDFGRFQLTTLFLIGLAVVVASFDIMIMIFTTANVDHWCQVPQLFNLTDNATLIKQLTLPLVKRDGKIQYSQCERFVRNYSQWTVNNFTNEIENDVNSSETEPCLDGWVYDTSVFTSTIVTEFDLVCEKQSYPAIAGSIFMAGMMCGVLVFGTLSDTYGRKLAFVISLIFTITFSIQGFFTDSFNAFATHRFFLGLSSSGLFSVIFVLGMEIGGSEWRMFAGILVQFVWAVAYLPLALGSFYIRSRQILQFVFYSPVFLLLLAVWYLPESPRWLYSKHQTRKANRLIHKIAERNYRKMPENFEIISEDNTAKVYIWDIFRYPKLRLMSLNIFFSWMVTSLVYYGLSFSTGNLHGNIHINFALSGTSEIFGYLFCYLTMNHTGRRLALCGTLVTGGSLLLFTLVPGNSWVTIPLAMIGKACIAASFAILYLYTAELFPTEIRNAGVGAGTFCARIGGFLAPQIGLLGIYNHHLPFLIFGLLAIIAGMLTLLLPETKKEELSEHNSNTTNLSTFHI